MSVSAKFAPDNPSVEDKGSVKSGGRRKGDLGGSFHAEGHSDEDAFSEDGLDPRADKTDTATTSFDGEDVGEIETKSVDPGEGSEPESPGTPQDSVTRSNSLATSTATPRGDGPFSSVVDSARSPRATTNEAKIAPAQQQQQQPIADLNTSARPTRLKQREITRDIPDAAVASAENDESTAKTNREAAAAAAETRQPPTKTRENAAQNASRVGHLGTDEVDSSRRRSKQLKWHAKWKTGDPVEAYFSKLGWCSGHVERVYRDDAGEWLVVRDARSLALKEVDRFDTSVIRPVGWPLAGDTTDNENAGKLSGDVDAGAAGAAATTGRGQNDTSYYGVQSSEIKAPEREERLRWAKGSAVEVFFSRLGWVECTVARVLVDEDGEWIDVTSGTGHKKMVRRFDAFEIRNPSQVFRVEASVIARVGGGGPRPDGSAVTLAPRRSVYLRLRQRDKTVSKSAPSVCGVAPTTRLAPFFIKNPIMLDPGLPVSVHLIDHATKRRLGELEFKSPDTFLKRCMGASAAELPLRRPNSSSLFETETGLRLAIRCVMVSPENGETSSPERRSVGPKARRNTETVDKDAESAADGPAPRAATTAMTSDTSLPPLGAPLVGRLVKVSSFGRTRERWVLLGKDALYYSPREATVRDATQRASMRRRAQEAAARFERLPWRRGHMSIIPYNDMKNVLMINSDTFVIHVRKNRAKKSKYTFRADSPSLAARWYQAIRERCATQGGSGARVRR